MSGPTSNSFDAVLSSFGLVEGVELVVTRTGSVCTARERASGHVVTVFVSSGDIPADYFAALGALQTVSVHPHLLSIQGTYLLDDGQLVLVAQHQELGTLRAALNTAGGYATRNALALVARLVSAVIAVRRSSDVAVDISTDTVFLQPDGAPALLALPSSVPGGEAGDVEALLHVLLELVTGSSSEFDSNVVEALAAHDIALDVPVFDLQTLRAALSRCEVQHDWPVTAETLETELLAVVSTSNPQPNVVHRLSRKRLALFAACGLVAGALILGLQSRGSQPRNNGRAVVTTTTTSTLLEPAPSNVRIVSDTGDQVGLQWDAVASRVYVVRVTDGDTQVGPIRRAPTNAATVIDGLAPEASYCFRVGTLVGAEVSPVYASPVCR